MESTTVAVGIWLYAAREATLGDEVWDEVKVRELCEGLSTRVKQGMVDLPVISRAVSRASITHLIRTEYPTDDPISTVRAYPPIPLAP